VAYAELQVASAFSFLRGASSPEELAATASVLGLSAIGITDLNSVAGVVRMYDAAKEVGIRLVVGARLSFRDATPDLLCYPRDRAAWGRLTRLLTVGKGRVPHGDTSDAAKATNRCFLHYADLLEHGEGQILLVVAPDCLDGDFRANVQRLKQDFRGRAYIAANRRYRGDDASRLRMLADLPLPMVATNDVLYHLPDRRPLQDVDWRGICSKWRVPLPSISATSPRPMCSPEPRERACSAIIPTLWRVRRTSSSAADFHSRR
jgi:error-prone DNA polymerase